MLSRILTAAADVAVSVLVAYRSRSDAVEHGCFIVDGDGWRWWSDDGSITADESARSATSEAGLSSDGRRRARSHATASSIACQQCHSQTSATPAQR